MKKSSFFYIFIEYIQVGGELINVNITFQKANIDHLMFFATFSGCDYCASNIKASFSYYVTGEVIHMCVYMREQNNIIKWNRKRKEKSRQKD